jgi:P-type Mg2+ transporter
VYITTIANRNSPPAVLLRESEAILAAQPFDMAGWKKIDEVPFHFERRRVSVLVEHEAKRRLIVKGAPEDLLLLSGRYENADGEEKPLDGGTRSVFEATLDALGAQGFRALGIASRSVDSGHDTAVNTDENNLSVRVGLPPTETLVTPLYSFPALNCMMC